MSSIFGRRKWHAYRGICAGIVAFLMLASRVSQSVASTKSCRSGAGTKLTNSALCEGLAFHRGQTIVFHTGTVGSSNDTAARALAPLIQEYLSATVEVVNQTGSTNIPTSDATAAAIPNGLTVGFILASTAAVDVLTNTPGFNVNLGRLGWIAGQYGTLNVFAATPNSDFQRSIG